jgi:hypothetical protein
MGHSKLFGLGTIRATPERRRRRRRRGGRDFGESSLILCGFWSPVTLYICVTPHSPLRASTASMDTPTTLGSISPVSSTCACEETKEGVTDSPMGTNVKWASICDKMTTEVANSPNGLRPLTCPSSSIDIWSRMENWHDRPLTVDSPNGLRPLTCPSWYLKLAGMLRLRAASRNSC